jgi:hypothetical protein
MKRNALLAAALFLALGMIGLLGQPATTQGPEGAVMTGVWSWRNLLPAVPGLIPAGSTLPSILVFHNDGTVQCSDALAFGGFPLNPNNYTPFYGVWERTGPHKFTATFYSLRFDGSTRTLIGFARARANFAFSTDFDHITGVLFLDFLDSTAGPLMVPNPLAPGLNWTPDPMCPLNIEAARVSVVPY